MGRYTDGIYRPLGQSQQFDHDIQNYVYNLGLTTAVLRTYGDDPVMTRDRLIALLSQPDFLQTFMDSCLYFALEHNCEAQQWTLEEYMAEVVHNDFAITMLLNNWDLFDTVVKDDIFCRPINYSIWSDHVSYLTEMYIIGANLHHYGQNWVVEAEPESVEVE